MSLYVLDTDILTLFQRNDPAIAARVAAHYWDEVAISVVTVEEQLSGWYTQLRQAKELDRLAWAYGRLAANVRFLAFIRIVDFEKAALVRYEELKRLRLKVRKMDLQIAATALHHGGIVVTRNVSDFNVIPGLTVEDWSK
jgi:tRNA(fMet)-specific endonuclease VapC